MCPACHSLKTTLLRRKYLVTALYHCEDCQLMFRVPKDTREESHEFYQADYEQGFTTQLPDRDTIEGYKRCGFVGTAKDYSDYVAVLHAAGLRSGQVVFDFGCSWGYGSWQLRKAGFKVYSYEISAPRARYAKESLECEMYPPERLPEKVDCFFSAHVIEHLPDPCELWRMAKRVLKRDGMFVCFLPNGNLSLENTVKGFHQRWGQAHPLLLSPECLLLMAQRYGFEPTAYTSPYNLELIASRQPGPVTGDEMVVIARLSRE